MSHVDPPTAHARVGAGKPVVVTVKLDGEPPVAKPAVFELVMAGFVATTRVRSSGAVPATFWACSDRW